MKIKSLTFRIFINTFLTGALVYFFCAICFIFALYSYFEEQIYKELETEEQFVSTLLEHNSPEELSDLEIKNRITLIHKDGTVYFDNTADFSKMENHGLRSEFIGAVENGQARTSRFSDTMLEKTLYFAKLSANGDVIRISCEQHTVGVLILGMSRILLILLVAAMIVSGISASWVSKKIVEPFGKIDLENPELTETYSELKPFTKHIAEENFEKSRREQLRQQFSANVSHELKTPLTSISGFAEILKSGNTDQRTTKDFAETIYNETQRMICLVNDIIKLSKLDEKSICIEKEEMSLQETAQDAIDALTSVAKSKNVTLSLKGDAGFIFGVKPVIYEMIFNLIDNGIKYNKENGTVEVVIETVYAHVHGKNVPEKVMLTVKDSGIGIAADEKERIFERFYRIDKSRSKESGGTGLGLSIVKHAAKYHDAVVSLDSAEGQGSTFTVQFSCRKDNA